MADRYVIPGMVDSFLKAYQKGDFRPEFKMPLKGYRDHSLFHASEAFKCHRRRIFSRIGLEQGELSGTSMRNFFMGDATEEMICLGIKWACENDPTYKGIKPIFQYKVTVAEWQVKGTADLLLVFPDGITDVIDIKSCKPGKIDYVKAGESDQGYHGQATTYAKGARDDGHKIGNVYITYVDKGNWNTHPDWVHPAEVMPKLREDYAKLIQEWNEFQKTKVVPRELPLLNESIRFPKRKRYVTPGGQGLFPQWECGYCGHVGQCKTITKWNQEHPRTEE